MMLRSPSLRLPPLPRSLSFSMLPILRLCLLASLALTVLPAAASFDLEDLNAIARERAENAYQPPDNRLPAALATLSYDNYRKIRYRSERSVWHKSKLPFELQFQHPGMGYDRRVKIHIISSDGVREQRFDTEAFDYADSGVDPAALEDIGFAGLRVHYPVNDENTKDEVLVFHGASYFRGLGREQRYGLSARGLAVDTGELSGEEFPHFSEFWIEWPRAQDHELTIYALLDSPRMTGAYRFRLKPGESTTVQVAAHLHFRSDVAKIGIAPLTSMYLFGENQPRQQEDYRPEVHDSDGLLLHTGEEWIWRPLTNPRRLFITSFGVNHLRGFGLMQRDRHFGSYEDLEARYERRPSAWIAPRSDWGRGRVELVTIPTPDETNDNIVAYWVPERAPRAGEHLQFEYELAWQMLAETAPPLARVVQTRRGPGLQRDDDALRFHVDFAGGELDALPEDAQLVAGVWVGDGGELLDRQLRRNEATGGYRLTLRVRRPDETRPLEMRAILRNGEQTLTETWAYAMPATAGR